MENYSSGTSILSNFGYSGGGQITPLPPRSPPPPYNFPCRGLDCTTTSSMVGSPPGHPKPSKEEEGHVHHHRSSSDSFLIEQPSWLDELLSEPKSPRSISHRRSSSDSITYLDSIAQTFMKEDTNTQQNVWTTSHANINSNTNKQQNKAWQSPFHSKNSMALQTFASSFAAQEPCGALVYKANGKKAQDDCLSSSAKNDISNVHPSTSRADSKRTKQQFAQRSRLRKLQYIAELEKNVQVLQAQGSEVSAALGYLDRQLLLLGMENQALKQRLDSLSQEQLVKYLEQEMLEREMARLQFLYHQQQLQQKHSAHHRSRVRELEPEFANLSIT